MARVTSERRKQRRHYLKYMKKQIGRSLDGVVFTTSDFADLKRKFAEEGKQARIDDLREKLNEEQDNLANQEGEMREKLKSEGKKKKEIDSIVESWYEKQKIWSLHKDVYNHLV